MAYGDWAERAAADRRARRVREWGPAVGLSLLLVALLAFGALLAGV